VEKIAQIVPPVSGDQGRQHLSFRRCRCGIAMPGVLGASLPLAR